MSRRKSLPPWGMPSLGFQGPAASGLESRCTQISSGEAQLRSLWAHRTQFMHQDTESVRDGAPPLPVRCRQLLAWWRRLWR